MSSLNRVTLIGVLGRDPESRTTQGGQKIVSLSMATSETWNDKASGERKEKTEWHRVVIFDQRVGETAEKYLKKGSRALIEGKLCTRKYTNKDGVEQSTTEVTVEQFRGQLILLDRPAGNGDRAESRPAAATASRPAPAAAARSWENSAMDDDIPF